VLLFEEFYLTNVAVKVLQFEGFLVHFLLFRDFLFSRFFKWWKPCDERYFGKVGHIL